jgi:hypothetical protein
MGEVNEKEQTYNAIVVGSNLLILAVYTFLSKILKEDGLFLDAILLAIHVFFCVTAAIIFGKWIWVLTALVVLLIGVSTCVGILYK